MKLIRVEGDNLVFQIGQREKQLLFEVLKLYPVLPSTQHRLSRNADRKEIEADQKLLEEALAERKLQNKRQLLALLDDPGRFVERDGAYRFTLSTPQMEWLLQVLNDVRVGSWLRLGEPDERRGKPIQLTPDNVPFLAAMEFCGFFQMALLNATDRPA